MSYDRTVIRVLEEILAVLRRMELNDAVAHEETQGTLLAILATEDDILQTLVAPPTDITGGSIHQTGDPMVPIAPGNTPQYTVTPTPADASPAVATASVFTVVASDPSITVAQDPSVASGLACLLTLPAALTVPFNGTITWNYTNADGVAATPATIDFSDTTTPVVDITGGTLAQTA